MKLTELTVAEYLKLLASDAPAPGGGSASALCGAQGAGLCVMVAGLTVGRKKYAGVQELVCGVRDEAQRLCEALTAQIDADTAAFNQISAALALPRETEEQKTARRAALQTATLAATREPLRTLSLARDALAQTVRLVGNSNRTCASDLAVAGHDLLACAEGAWLNVEVNLPGLGDEALAETLGAQGRALLEECRALSAQLR